MKFSSTIRGIARKYGISESHLSYLVDHHGGAQFQHRGITFRPRGNLLEVVARPRCVACNATVTPNRRIVVDRQAVCPSCHRAAFFGGDAEARRAIFDPEPPEGAEGAEGAEPEPDALDMTQLGERMAQAGITQAELAEAAGISSSSVWRAKKRGWASPRIARAISEVL